MATGASVRLNQPWDHRRTGSFGFSLSYGCRKYLCRVSTMPHLSMLLWIFPGAPLKVNRAPGNIQGNLTVPQCPLNYIIQARSIPPLKNGWYCGDRYIYSHWILVHWKLKIHNPDSNVGWPNVGPTSVLSSRRWPNVSPTCIALWECEAMLLYSRPKCLSAHGYNCQWRSSGLHIG